MNDSAPAEPAYADRVHRSKPGAVAGVLLIALALWLGIDAMLGGSGRDVFIALAALVLVVPGVIAWTLWPSVRYNEERLVVRNPLRTVTVPWAAVDDFRSGYSVEMLTGGKKYQVWAIPVSLRQRKKANVRAARAAAGGDPYAPVSGLFGGGRRRASDAAHPIGGPGLRGALRAQEGADRADPTVAWSDRVVSELRERAEAARAGSGDAAPAPARATWTWALIAPMLIGLIALIVLLAG
ncbi:PH domain-containing protein [Phaeacidiphilus oryzae]|uniref:PH domain-containing protein n=1 Tax=Phaeacidiphilus oryzae TaxID=348818 RepID=UPI00055C8005|nr:PH domain-containing protein [Phaeacidiphilus oryzae]